MSHQGETAFLTGGASGIGRAVTAFLQGARNTSTGDRDGSTDDSSIKVFIVDIDDEGAQTVADHLNRTSPDGQLVWAAQCDVGDWDSQRLAFEQAIDTFHGRIDYVLPIAGIGERRMFPNDPTTTAFHRPDLKVIEVDEIGVIYTVSLAVQHFRRMGKDKHGFRGRILAVASVCGFYIHTTIPLYTAAKHAIVGFVRAYGRILAEEAIALNAICPNKIRTGISTAAVYDRAEARGVLVPMETLLQAFDALLPGGEFAAAGGECIEVAPQLGVRRREFVDFVNEESRVSAEMTYERSRYLHDAVEGPS